MTPRRLLEGLALACVLFVPLVAAYVLLAGSSRPAARGPRLVTLANLYPSPRELFEVAAEAAPTFVATLNASGGLLAVELREGAVYGWRSAGQRTCASRAALEGVVEVEGEAFPDVYVLGNDRRADATFTNGSPTAVTATHRSDGAEARVVEATRLAPNETATFAVLAGDFVDWATDGELVYRSVVEYPGATDHVFTGAGKHHDLCRSAAAPSKPLRRTSFVDGDGVKRRVEVFREDPFIAFLPGWVSTQDCAELRDAADREALSDATTGGKQNTIATVRRSKNAMLPWDDPGGEARTTAGGATTAVTRLVTRAHAVARRFARLDVDAGPWAEPVNFIRYDVADEYRTHCDGVCRRYPYTRGGRVATMIHYCRAPAAGGATVFPNAGLKFAPKRGGGLFFAYKDPETGAMDHGKTEHAGCLVTNGTKEIATVWMREALSKDEDWRSFYDRGVT